MLKSALKMAFLPIRQTESLKGVLREEESKTKRLHLDENPAYAARDPTESWMTPRNWQQT